MTHEPTEQQRALSVALLRERAPEHVDHYTGHLVVEVRPECRPTGRDACEDSLEISIAASPSWCDCGAYLAGVIVARPPGGHANIYTDEEDRELLARVTGLWLLGP